MGALNLQQVITDDHKMIQLSRNGIPYTSFASLMDEMDFQLKEWSFILHLTERSLQRYKKEGRLIEQPYAERIIEIARLRKLGIDVFGEEDYFNRWLRTNSIALGGKCPLEFLDTTVGISLMMDELVKIEHGILA